MSQGDGDAAATPAPRLEDLPLNQWRDAAEMAAAVAAAADAGIFQALANGGSSPEELAARLRLDGRAARIILAALVDLGLLAEDGDRYTLTDRAARELADPDSPDYVAGGLPLWLENLRIWTRLPAALRTGEPQLESGGEELGGPEDEAIARFMAGMAATPAARVRRVVERCLARHRNARTVLDVGGGPGLFAREFVRAGLAATLYDRPEVIDHVADAYDLARAPGITLATGDFNSDPLPSGPFDVVLLGNVCHIYSPAENRALLAKVHEVLAPGGVIAIGDFLRGRSPRAARFAIVMLLRTDAGDTYTEDEYRSWLRDAGFRDLQTEDVDVDRQLVTAVKA